jgi:hypothetical protein
LKTKRNQTSTGPKNVGHLPVPSDLQLMEMETFLTNPSECTIMGLDPNFNLGEFVVMSIVYKNLKLIHGRTGKCPTFLGPVLV